MTADVEYTPSTTVSDFITSESFYNFIIGPVGPVSADTEFLTPEGWKRIDQYVEGDEVAQWTPDPDNDPTAGKLEFVAPDDYIVGPATEFNYFHNKHSLSMCVSDAHRVPYYDYRGQLQEAPGGHVAQHPSTRLVPTAFIPVDRPGTGISEAVLRLAVAIHADGSFPSMCPTSTARKDWCVVSLRKERKKTRLRQLLEAAGVPYSERTYPQRPTETVVSFHSPYVGKRYDEHWWRATAVELSIVLDEMSYWDGLFEGDETRFSTTSKSDADFMQYAAHACGGRASINAYDDPRSEAWATVYTVGIARAGSKKAAVRIRDTTQIDKVPAEGGKQYCFSTPSTYFLARHNGCVFVTGNSAKTTGILFKILYHARRQAPGKDGKRRTRWVVVRNTAPQLKDTTINSFFTWFKPGVAGKWVSGRTMFVFEFDDVYAEVMFRPLDTPDDVSRVLSLEVTGAVLDEFVEIPKAIVEALSGRCGRYPSTQEGGCTWWGMWGASNPGNEDNWWFEWLDVTGTGVRPKNMAYFEQPSGWSEEAENVENLPGKRGYYENLAEGKSPEWVKQFIEVQWGYSLSGKPVYSAFNADMHIAKKPIPVQPNLPLIIGFDAGLTPSAIFGQQDLHGRVLTLDELVSNNMGAQRFCRTVLLPLINSRFRNVKEIYLVGDPAMVQRAQSDERSVMDILKEELDFPVDIAFSNTLVDRIGAVEYQLSTLTPVGAALLVDPRCKVLIRGYRSGYMYRINTKGAVGHSPDKNEYSHPHDANQYMMMGFSNVKRQSQMRKRVQSIVQGNSGNMSSYARW